MLQIARGPNFLPGAVFVLTFGKSRSRMSENVHAWNMYIWFFLLITDVHLDVYSITFDTDEF